ncbi:Hsp70 family protein [Nakamurella aerolata]|uniref:Hsp70 family protein n=1 Tax=Nakamurella aerolata TaxID=1656892 RepID=A0A849AA58_9ACTN|nr:Hsp70 family protein [Nakamurella aerolata]NNG36493.1 Hsp70 family protein [Nakamurella aerolata]
MIVLSIDFGTSNTVAVLRRDDAAPYTLEFDGSSLLPSAVFLADDGTLIVGREALRSARIDPSRFEPNPKRRIDDGDLLLGHSLLTVVDVIAAVLRTVNEEATRQTGGVPVDRVVLTHPAQWATPRRSTLLAAARQAGLSQITLIVEPVAAAARFTRGPGREIAPGGAVAIYDLGAGTFDAAVVGRSRGAGPQQLSVLAEDGIPDLGGLDFDEQLKDFAGRTARGQHPEAWDRLLHPTDPATRRAARAFAEDVRASKETLSRYPQTDIPLPPPAEDVHISRPEFEGLVRAGIQRTVAVLDATIRRAGLTPAELSGIYLVGGSSRIPLISKTIQQQLGVTPTALDQPESVVALGASDSPTDGGTRRTDHGPTQAVPSGPLPPPAGAFPARPSSDPDAAADQTTMFVPPARPAAGAWSELDADDHPRTRQEPAAGPAAGAAGFAGGPGHGGSGHGGSGHGGSGPGGAGQGGPPGPPSGPGPAGALGAYPHPAGASRSGPPHQDGSGRRRGKMALAVGGAALLVAGVITAGALWASSTNDKPSNASGPVTTTSSQNGSNGQRPPVLPGPDASGPSSSENSKPQPSTQPPPSTTQRSAPVKSAPTVSSSRSNPAPKPAPKPTPKPKPTPTTTRSTPPPPPTTEVVTTVEVTTVRQTPDEPTPEPTTQQQTPDPTTEKADPTPAENGPPPAEAENGIDLGVSVPISSPGCSGQYVVFVGSAVVPGKYAEDVQRFLNNYPDAQYLRTDATCSSFSPDYKGNPIYSAYYGPYSSKASACEQRNSLGGDATVKQAIDSGEPLENEKC